MLLCGFSPVSFGLVSFGLVLLAFGVVWLLLGFLVGWLVIVVVGFVFAS